MRHRAPSNDPILTSAVPPDVARRIRELAREEDRTTSAFIRRVLVAHVANRVEDGGQR